ncbi:hypothetical protein BSLG_004225 [Batrachochytrium salamandrivorans]|nr:hypothetical protein BSLG_004225 [Batrachochytrium salamandrivorans]
MSYNIPGLCACEDLPAFVNGYHSADPNQKCYCRCKGNKLVSMRSYLYIQEAKMLVNGWFLIHENKEDAIKSIAGAGGRVTHSYTLGFGPKYHMMGPGQFNEDAFVAMDHALALCRKYGVRLIVPLVNQNSQDFKDLLKFMLNRRNTVNGIRYGDDQSILGWQTGNELGGWEGKPPPAAWTIEIAQFIKSLAPRTMVIDGTMGGHNLKDESTRSVANSAFIVGEFGLSSTPNLERVVAAIAKNTNISCSGRSPSEPYPVPSAPGLIEGVTPSALRWIGSAWASHYILSRRDCLNQAVCRLLPIGESSPWKIIAEKVTDNVEWGRTIYSDRTAIRAQSYCYRVKQ